MGNEKEGYREVEITKDFYIGKHEVTQEQFATITQKLTQDIKSKREKSRPMDNVSWIVAQAFCIGLNARELAAGRLPAGYTYSLPKEAQWENA